MTLFPTLLFAQEQLLPPLTWAYRLEGAASVERVAAANSSTYLIGYQTGSSKAQYTSYNPYKEKINKTQQVVSPQLEQGLSELFVQALDEQGKAQWRKTWAFNPSKNKLRVQAFAVDKSNNLHIMGQFSGRIDFDQEGTTNRVEKTEKDIPLLYLLQLNSSGKVLAVRSYPITELDPSGIVISVVLDQPQSYLYILQHNGTYSKLTMNGEVVWSKKVLGNNHYEDFTVEPSDMAVDSKDNLYILRYSDYHHEQGEYRSKTIAVPSSILKIAPNGEKIWESAINTNSKTSFVVDDEGQVYWWSALLNSRWTGTEAHFEIYMQATLLLGKIDAQGQEIWQKRYLADDWTTATDITLVNNEELYATSSRKIYQKTFGESITAETAKTSFKAHSKTVQVFDLEGQERWKYSFAVDQLVQEQFSLHYDPSSKKLLLWGIFSPNSDLDPSPEHTFPAGESSSQQVFQWSPVFPRP